MIYYQGLAHEASYARDATVAREVAPGKTMADALCAAGVESINISLDTLDRAVYSQVTGRDFHEQVLRGIDAAITAGFGQLKLNTVLMRGRNEEGWTIVRRFTESTSAGDDARDPWSAYGFETEPWQLSAQLTKLRSICQP